MFNPRRKDTPAQQAMSPLAKVRKVIKPLSLESEVLQDLLRSSVSSVVEEDLEEEIVEKDIEASKKHNTDDNAGLKRTDVPRKSSFISTAGNRRCLKDLLL